MPSISEILPRGVAATGLVLGACGPLLDTAEPQTCPIPEESPDLVSPYMVDPTDILTSIGLVQIDTGNPNSRVFGLKSGSALSTEVLGVKTVEIDEGSFCAKAALLKTQVPGFMILALNSISDNVGEVYALTNTEVHANGMIINQGDLAALGASEIFTLLGNNETRTIYIPLIPEGYEFETPTEGFKGYAYYTPGDGYVNIDIRLVSGEQCFASISLDPRDYQRPDVNRSQAGQKRADEIARLQGRYGRPNSYSR